MIMNGEEADVNLNYEDDEDDARHINENGKSDGDQDDYLSGSQWKLGLEEAP